MNKVILIGRLTKDPVVRYTPTQKVVCQFTLAVDRPFVNKDGQREADFIPVVLWGKQAELAGNNCAKGHRLCVEGRMQVRTYEDKNSNKVWVTEVIGDRIEFLESKGKTSAPPVSADGASAPQPSAMSGMGEEVPFGEEIPF
ncbi:single-stranded DNA-binding protein [uncultured Succiniclasticum sp.]|uniref:single-stranded DNA-binding protein n=1 Tax=uncultured Succiniclasticum sp. TaxID=1500547 RepID=UPI0026012DDF|nr:single-stranded DNA-binding protein [uncultured Succiniclasticum sp.]